MATDNPLLAGMLGGIELARATMGNQLAQQQATMNSVLQMQQMQQQAAQSRQLFEMKQTEILAQTRLNEFTLREKTQQAAMAVKLAEIEAPVKQAEFTARLQDAQTKSATAMMEFNKLTVANQADRIYSGLSTVTFGIGDPAQSRAVSQQFFQSQAAEIEKLPEDQRPLAAQGLRAALTRYQTEELDRAKMARADAAKMISEFTQFAGSTQDETAVKATKELYAAQLSDLATRTGVDMTSAVNTLTGTSVGGESAADRAKRLAAGATTFAGDWRRLEQDPVGVAAGENTSLLESARANADSVLREYAGAVADPESRRYLGISGQLLDPVLNATRKGLTEPSWIGKAFGQGAAADKQVSTVPSPFGFGEVPATTRKVRSLTAGELAELSKSKDPRRVLDILTSAVVSVNEPEPQAPFQYIPGF